MAVSLGGGKPPSSRAKMWKVTLRTSAAMEQSFVATSVKQLPGSESITSPVSVLVQHKYPKLRPPHSLSPSHCWRQQKSVL